MYFVHERNILYVQYCITIYLFLYRKFRSVFKKILSFSNIRNKFIFNYIIFNRYPFSFCFSLPYLEAAIRETMRIETLAPLSLIHKAMKNTTLGGYNIPANTPILTNLAAMHHDPDLWGDPEIFRPERFLKEDGQLGKDITLPFGFGKLQNSSINSAELFCICKPFIRLNLMIIILFLFLCRSSAMCRRNLCQI